MAHHMVCQIATLLIFDGDGKQTQPVDHQVMTRAGNRLVLEKHNP
jgi:hypothetical protein